MIPQRKSPILEGTGGVFGDEAKAESSIVDMKTLHPNILLL